jgi:hypothetical protein
MITDLKSFKCSFPSMISRLMHRSCRQMQNPVSVQCPSQLMYEIMKERAENQFQSATFIINEMVERMKRTQRGTMSYWNYYCGKNHNKDASVRLHNLLLVFPFKFNKKLKSMKVRFDYDHRNDGLWVCLRTGNVDHPQGIQTQQTSIVRFSWKKHLSFVYRTIVTIPFFKHFFHQ